MAARLEGAVAIVTAGGQGIGEAIAKSYAREGAAVAVVDLNKDEAERVAAEIRSSDGKAIAIAADVTRTPAVAEMVKGAVAAFGTVDILVNAAGGFHQLV